MADKKLDKFQKELDELCSKYQYSLSSQLQVTVNGIVPKIVVNNVPPKDDKVDNKDKKDKN